MCVSLIFSFPAGGGRGQTGCRPSGSLRPLSAGKEESPLPVPAAARCAVPALVLLQRLPVPRIFIFKSIRCPAAGSIINKRPARIKRGRLRVKDSLKSLILWLVWTACKALFYTACADRPVTKCRCRVTKCRCGVTKSRCKGNKKSLRKFSNMNDYSVLFH